jgi:hypothetical protein
MQNVIWRQCLSCNRADGAKDALTPTRNNLSFTPRRSEGRKASASHMTTTLCACARTTGPSRRTDRETLLQTLSGCRSIRCLALGPVHAGLSLVRKSSLGPGSEWAVTSLLKHCGASSSCFSLAVNISLQGPLRRSGLAPVHASVGQGVGGGHSCDWM